MLGPHSFWWWIGRYAYPACLRLLRCTAACVPADHLSRWAPVGRCCKVQYCTVQYSTKISPYQVLDWLGEPLQNGCVTPLYHYCTVLSNPSEGVEERLWVAGSLWVAFPVYRYVLYSTLLYAGERALFANGFDFSRSRPAESLTDEPNKPKPEATDHM